jgi:signal transduction histidine kinase
METLIDDILTLARGSEASTDEEPVDIAALVDECWGRLGAEDASLVVDTDRTVTADRSRLTQLIENLLQNAVDHDGDSVTVTVGDRPDGGFYVEDDGPGISPADRDDVFKAGYSTAETGTGFGLRIVEQVAEEHGLTVDLSEGRDGGTRFEIADDSSGDARHDE